MKNLKQTTLLISTFIIMFFLSSCAKPQTTKLEVKLDLQALSSAVQEHDFDGGAMLVLESQNDLIIKVMASSETSFEIPNGIWSIRALGWDSDVDGNKMTGTVHCAHLPGVNLYSSSESFVMNLSNSNCALPVFGPHKVDENSGIVSFYPAKIDSCNTLPAMGTDCSYNVAQGGIRNRNEGFALSAQLYVKDAHLSKVTNSTISENEIYMASSCFKHGPNTHLEPIAAVSQINMPSGTVASRFPLGLRLYFGSDDCMPGSLSPSFDDHLMPKGFLTVNHPKVRSALSNTAAAGLEYFDIKAVTNLETICNLGREVRFLSGTQVTKPYPAGKGTNDLPFVLCTPQDFNKIRNIDHTASFLQARDLDFHSLTAAFSMPTPPVPCTGGGDNFVPVGREVLADCSTSTDLPFSGIYDANNKSLLNMRSSSERFPDGIFPKTDNAVFLDLSLHKAEITGEASVGFVGEAMNTSFENIKISDSNFEARPMSTISDVGALVGHFTGASKATLYFQNIAVMNTHIRSEGDHTGGILGNASKFKANNLSFNGFISSEKHDPSMTTTYIGGIAGLTDSINLSQAYSDAYISTNGSFVGGLIGKINLDNSDISNSINYSFIHSYKDTNLVLGDLFGEIVTAGSSNTASNLFNLGSHTTNCNTPCNIGEIAGTSGTGTPILSTLFDLSTFNRVNGGIQALTEATKPYGEIVNMTNFQNFLQDSCSSYHNVSLANQQQSGLGTQSNPLIICTRDQFQELSNLSAGLYVELRKSINLGIINTSLNLSAHLDGRHHMVIIDHFASGIQSLFTNIYAGATIKNLKLVGNETNTTSANPYAALVYNNYGEIKNVLSTSKISSGATFQSGIITGLVINNYGTLSGVDSFSHLVGSNTFSIAHTNHSSGVIEKSFSMSHHQLNANAVDIAGMIDTNYGVVTRNSIGDSFFTGSYSVSGLSFIANTNSGQMDNNLIEDSASLHFSSITPTSIHHFVKTNSSGASLNHNISLAEIQATNLPAQNNVKPIGTNNGNMSSNLYFHIMKGKEMDISNPIEFTCQADESFPDSISVTSSVNFDTNTTYSFEFKGHDQTIKATAQGNNSTLITLTSFNGISCRDGDHFWFDVYQTFSDPMPPTGTSFYLSPGQLSPQALDTTYGYNIASMGEDGNNGHRFDDLINLYGDLLTQGYPSPGNDIIWEWDRGKPRLLNMR